MSDFQSFAEFWPYYVRQHSSPGCRALHFVGSTLAVAAIMAAPFVNWWLLLAAPIIGYSFAWIGHYTVEKNRPATFHHPLWSFLGDWKMWALTLVGRMQAEVDRATGTSGR